MIRSSLRLTPKVARLRSGKSKRGLSKGGLGPKGANWAKKGLFGAISALPSWLWGAEELVPIGPEKAPIGPEKAPICPEKTRFSMKDFPPIFSENLGLKPPFVSPRLDFPNTIFFAGGAVRSPAISAMRGGENRPAPRGPPGQQLNQGKKKHININKFAGLSRDWVGAKILFMCFFRVIPYGGEKHIKQNSPQNPGTIP